MVSEPTKERPSLGARVRSALRVLAAWFWSNAVVGLVGVWLVGQVFRDGNVATDLCFLVPTVFIAAGLFAVAGLARLCGCRRIAWASALLALLPTIGLLAVENRWIRPRVKANAGESLRLVNWNLWAGGAGWTNILGKLKAQNADIYVLSEVYQPADGAFLAEGLGADYSLFSISQFAVISRGRVRIERPVDRITNRAYLVRWQSRAGSLLLFLVDMPTRPIYGRNPLLDVIRHHIGAFRPDITVGDFNLSRRTRALSELPQGYSHAYYRAGAGWSYTWPAWFPLWDIDQCVVGPKIRPLRYSLHSTRLSDHRMQVLDFTVAPSK